MGRGGGVLGRCGTILTGLCSRLRRAPAGRDPPNGVGTLRGAHEARQHALGLGKLDEVQRDAAILEDGVEQRGLLPNLRHVLPLAGNADGGAVRAAARSHLRLRVRE